MIKEKDISVGITGFIDILGFGKKVLSLETLEDINRIAEQVQMVQNEFEYNSSNKNSEEADLPTKSVLAFSDCVIVNIPIESESTAYTGTFDGYMFEFTQIALAQFACIQNSVFLRGGIDLGWWYNEDDIILSQSLTQAHEVEGKANVPIIALSNDLYGKFKNHPDMENFYGEDSGVLESMFELYNSKEGSFHFINYLEIALQNISWQTSSEQVKKLRELESAEERDKIRDDGFQQNLKRCLQVHSSEIKSAFNKAKKDNVKNKYRWLARYHNKIAEKWIEEENLLCKLENG